MINSPLLDVFIGIVFLFLLFSLLATSINEAIASALQLRGKMLRNAIAKTLLSDGPDANKGYINYYIEIGKQRFLAIREFFKNFIKPIENDTKLSIDFYRNAKIQKLGDSKKFPKPSYIPDHVFAEVISDLLNRYFEKYKDNICAQYEYTNEKVNAFTDMEKVIALLNYFLYLYENNNEQAAVVPIDKETLQVLLSFVKTSGLDLVAYQAKLQEWYNNTMDRMTGWYKRQTQLLLFVIGLSVACIWNVDIINYANELAKNDQMSAAIADIASEYAKNKETVPTGQTTDSITALIKNIEPNLPIGWRNYAISQFKENLPAEYQKTYDSIYKKSIVGNYNNIKTNHIDTIAKAPNVKEKDSLQIIKRISKLSHQQTMATIYDTNSTELSLHFFRKSLSFQKIIGYLLFALGICLGAPFWFDLLQKFTKIRGSGKRIDSNNADYTEKKTSPNINVTVNSTNSGNTKPIG